MFSEQEYKRAPGGLGFADVMLRSTAPTEKYVAHITALINKYLFKEEEKLRLQIKRNIVKFRYQNSFVLIMPLSWVERCRNTKVNGLEWLLVTKLLQQGVAIDTSLPYYVKWIEAKNDKN
ncbi:hypothetical protein V6C27_04935 [Peptococcaceae bacterium 1198_IL3148]